MPTHLEQIVEGARAYGLDGRPDIEPEEGIRLVNGLKLHYLDWGNREPLPMLLLHGGGQNAGAWDYFAALLCSQFHVMALDQRGHGESDWSPDAAYTREDHVADLVGFTSALGMDRLIMVGLSMGARNALYFTSRYPEQVAALVITDIGLHVDEQGSAQMAPLFEEPYELDSLEGFVDRSRRAYPNLPIERLRKGVVANTRRLPNGKWSWKYDMRVMHALREFEANHRDEYHATIRAIRRPTLIVRGAESKIMTPEDARALQSMIGGSRFLEIPNAGHRVMRENPVGYAAGVRDFLQAQGLW